jgi:hypothetical protein
VDGWWAAVVGNLTTLGVAVINDHLDSIHCPPLVPTRRCPVDSSWATTGSERRTPFCRGVGCPNAKAVGGTRAAVGAGIRGCRVQQPACITAQGCERWWGRDPWCEHSVGSGRLSRPGEANNPTEVMVGVDLVATVLKMGGGGGMNQTLRSDARSLAAAVASGNVHRKALSNAGLAISTTCARLGDSDNPTVTTEPMS